jgi:signal transduction histidine kinase
MGAGASDEKVLTLDSAQFLLSDAPMPPPDSAPWQSQALPDNWMVSRPGVFGYGWYRLSFELPRRPEGQYGVYMPWFRTVGTLYVNGTEVGRTGSVARPPFRLRPQYFVVPPHLLRAGGNQLQLRLFVKNPWRGAVSAVTIGEDELVKPLYEREFFLRVTGFQFNGILSGALGLFFLLLWLRRREESMYGYFGLVALLWGVDMAAAGFMPEPPVAWVPYVAMFIEAGNFLANGLLFFFALRYAGRHWPRVERLAWVYCALCLPAAWLAEGSASPFGKIWYGFAFLPLTFGYLAILTAAARNRPVVERWLIRVAVLFFAVTLVYDIVIDLANAGLQRHSFDGYRLVPMYIALAWILTDRYVRSFEQERLNRELEERVARKHAELEENYERMREMEHQRAVVNERQRIMSDMHDGLGGQLMSTLSLVEQGEVSPPEVAAALRECIDDLRLTIDSLEPSENDLLPVLGNLRYRLDGRLKKQGIELDWQVKEVPKLACLTPQNVLHVLRIVQEALTNVVKHARASCVRVETGVEDPGGRVYIRVRDNGTGFSGDHTGYGIDNMRRRAALIGGRLEIEPSLAGTTLSLELPAG